MNSQLTTLDKNLVLTGHETFQCRNLWLKKGYDFIKSGKKFKDLDSVVFLGVGKNMVSSIRFWMRSFDIIDDNDELTSPHLNPRYRMDHEAKAVEQNEQSDSSKKTVLREKPGPSCG